MTQSLQNFPWKTGNTRLENGKRAAGKGGKSRVKEKEKDGKVRHATLKSFFLITAAELVVLV